MEVWLWVVIGILALIILLLFLKVYQLQKAAKEIGEAFADRLLTDTNILIDLSCRDRHMRHLANRMNTQLRKLRDERRRFQQGDLELKTAIMSISHDLRTPLTAICGYLDLLEQEEQTESVMRYLEIVKNRAEILKQLTEELFRYSMVVSTESKLVIATVVLNRALEDCIAAYYGALKERGIRPTIQMPEKEILRNLDSSALSRIFANLMQNAIRYSDGDLEITLIETGEIIFANTSSRLNEVQVGKLFDRFYTVEAARESAGLGLSIARTLVEQMNGTISARYFQKKLEIYIFFPQ